MQLFVFLCRQVLYLGKNIWKSKVFLLFSLVVLILSMSSIADFGKTSHSSKSLSTNVITFRLLAVQRKFRFNGVDKDMRSAEYLIDALLRHTNWNNASTTYVSYIHLLSSRNLAGHPKYGRFYKGDATKQNMKREIRNFLCQPGRWRKSFAFCKNTLLYWAWRQRLSGFRRKVLLYRVKTRLIIWGARK